MERRVAWEEKRKRKKRTKKEKKKKKRDGLKDERAVGSQ